jgi:hypothetical protein
MRSFFLLSFFKAIYATKTTSISNGMSYLWTTVLPVLSAVALAVIPASLIPTFLIGRSSNQGKINLLF